MIRNFDRTIGVVAGLFGSAGVTAMAVATHVLPGRSVDTAGLILLVHAAALLTLAVADRPRRLRFLGAMAMIAGVALFSGDLVFRAVENAHLFPMAAPIGGLLLIASWLILALGFAFDRG